MGQGDAVDSIKSEMIRLKTTDADKFKTMKTIEMMNYINTYNNKCKQQGCKLIPNPFDLKKAAKAKANTLIQKNRLALEWIAGFNAKSVSLSENVYNRLVAIQKDQKDREILPIEFQKEMGWK